MIEIAQVRMLAFSEHINTVRHTSNSGMKTFVAGVAIKFTMIITSASATSEIIISNPMMTVVVDSEDMTKEADYVYSYVYQTPSEDVYTGRWIVTYKAIDTNDNITMLSQDKFTLVSQRVI